MVFNDRIFYHIENNEVPISAPEGYSCLSGVSDIVIASEVMNHESLQPRNGLPP